VAGAVDLYAGAPSIQGSNLFELDKNPLNELSVGIEDKIGEQSQLTGTSIITTFESIIRAILGFPQPGSPIFVGDNVFGSLGNIDQYFGNVETFLGQLNPMDVNFDPEAAIKNFVHTMLHPSHLLAPISMDPNAPSPVTGFVPMANLALSAIAEVVGGAQEVIDAIMAGLGFPPGTATADNVDQVFQNLYAFLANPDLANALMDPVGAVKGFIEDMLHPTNMLAGMDPLTELINPFNIPLLDASKVPFGQFPQDQIHNLQEDLDSLWAGIEDAAAALLAPVADWLLPNVPVSSVGLFQPELLANPHYDTAESITAGAGWSWDGTVDHDGDGTGSVKLIADGATHQLFSDPAIPVSPSQQLHLEHWLRWSAVTGTGACFKLAVAYYLNGALVGTTDLQTISNPVANSGWVKLQGNYTVPPTGVNYVRLLLIGTSSVVTGTINWDTASVKKVQLFGQDFTTALVGDLNNLVTQVSARALLTDFTGLMNTLGLGSPTLTAITNRFAKTGATGLFDSSALTNMTAFPGIASNKIVSGFLDIARVPAHLLDRYNVLDLGFITDHVTNGLLGGAGFEQFDAADTSQARGSLNSIFGDVLNATNQIQALLSGTKAADVSGTSIRINFAAYPDGPIPPAEYAVVYSGTGTSQLGIRDGIGGWFPANNDGNRNATGCYHVKPTETDFQLIRGSLASIPQQGSTGGTPKISVMGRVNNPFNPTTFVWARGYCTGFLAFKGDIGCTVNGVETVWASNIPLTWSMDISMEVGVGINPRRYRVFSGTQLVYDYTEVGTVSQMGSAFRHVGLRAEIRTGSNGPTVPGTLAGATITDNAPPDVVGSGAHMYRTSTGGVGMPTGVNAVPNNFFQIVDYTSDDITCNLSNGSFTVTYDGWYHFDVGLGLTGAIFEDWCPYLFINGVGRKAGGPRLNEQVSSQSSFSIYLKAGDVCQAGTFRASGSNSVLTGEISGTWSYFSIALMNRSYA
jgi:hypothetical protein